MPNGVQRGDTIVYEGKRWPWYGHGRQFEVLNPCSSALGDISLVSVRDIESKKVVALPREGIRVITKLP
ncbi:MAG: hypothetical protein Q7S26_01200 [bacterium]|nr:hypothetical protein [bacterium]